MLTKDAISDKSESSPMSLLEELSAGIKKSKRVGFLKIWTSWRGKKYILSEKRQNLTWAPSLKNGIWVYSNAAKRMSQHTQEGHY